eukprot:1387220-Amorphochlora_amoeboformis.AAC.2
MARGREGRETSFENSSAEFKSSKQLSWNSVPTQWRITLYSARLEAMSPLSHGGTASISSFPPPRDLRSEK